MYTLFLGIFILQRVKKVFSVKILFLRGLWIFSEIWNSSDSFKKLEINWNWILITDQTEYIKKRKNLKLILTIVKDSLQVCDMGQLKVKNVKQVGQGAPKSGGGELKNFLFLKLRIMIRL